MEIRKVMFYYDDEYNYETGQYEQVEFAYQITDKEAEFLRAISVEQMYQHMRQAIGVMTPMKETKFIPTIKCGGIEISLQINYQLWSMRYDNNSEDNSPITEEEFDKLVDKDGTHAIDVRVRYEGKQFIKATTMCLCQIEEELNNCVCEEEWD